MKSQTRFQKWLKQPVFLDQGDSVIVSRAQSFCIFLQEAIVPFLWENGYLLQNTPQASRDLAVLIYSGKENRLPQHRNHRYDRDLFDYRMDSENWENFWNQWQYFADFYENTHLQSQIHEFIWTRLDIEKSPASAESDEQIEWEESENLNQKDDSGFHSDFLYVKDKHSLY
jgi:hypothetical protein